MSNSNNTSIKMRNLLLTLSLMITLSKADNPCANVLPQSDVDWTKLRGSWYHLLFYDGFGPTCRNMLIAEVNTELKFVNVEFYDLISYISSPKLVRNNFVFFRWMSDPAYIYTGIRPGFQRSKSSPKFASKKKSLARKLSEIKVSTYTVVGTDYENYLILMQCNERGPSIGISLRSLNVDEKLQNEIHAKLRSCGTDVTGFKLNGTLTCLQ